MVTYLAQPFSYLYKTDVHHLRRDDGGSSREALSIPGRVTLEDFRGELLFYPRQKCASSAFYCDRSSRIMQKKLSSTVGD